MDTMSASDESSSGSATSPEDLVRATMWTPEQQVQELKRRRQRSVPPIAEGTFSFTPRPTDVIVAVPSKHGTTWLLHIVHQLRMKGAEPDFEEQEEIMAWVERSQTVYGEDPNTKPQPAEPRLFFSHLPYNRIPKGGKLIYCCRDQQDAMYSLYRFFDTMWSLRGRVSLPIFANTVIDDWGIVAVVLNDLLVWWEHRHDDDVLFLFFDDLKEDHAGCVRCIAKFIGIDCDESLHTRVVHTTTHAEMARHHSKFDTHRAVIRYAQWIGEEPPTEFTGRVRKDGGKSGDGQKLPPEVKQCIEEKWQEIVTAKLGFQNLKEMREAWHKEQKQNMQSV